MRSEQEDADSADDVRRRADERAKRPADRCRRHLVPARSAGLIPTIRAGTVTYVSIITPIDDPEDSVNQGAPPRHDDR